MHIKKIENLSVEDEITNFVQNDEFNIYNIIYGLNGSGKSSISRLINNFSKGQSKNLFVKGKFLCNKNESYSTDVDYFHDNIFVFNCDFVAENLVFHKDNKDSYISQHLKQLSLKAK